MTGRPQDLSDLAMSFFRRFEEQGDPRDIDAAVDAAQQAADLAGLVGAEMAGYWSNLAIALSSRFELTGDVEDIDRSVALQRKAVPVSPPGSPGASTMFLNLAAILAQRFRRSGERADLDEAIEAGRTVVACLPENHPTDPSALHNLAICLMERGTAACDRADLDEAVTLSERAVGQLADADADAPAIIGGLGNALLARFEQIGSAADLDRSAEVLSDVLLRIPADHPDYAGWLNNYANVQLHLFRRSGALGYANAAIENYLVALDKTPSASPERVARLENLAASYLQRADHLGDVNDFDRCVSICEQLLGLIPETHPMCGAVLARLSSALRQRCEVTGSLTDADLAVATAERAIDSLGSSDRDGEAASANLLSHLAKALLTRVDLTGSEADADRAVSVAVQAADLSGDQGDQLEFVARTTDLANALLARGRRIGSSADTAHALELIRAAVSAMSSHDRSYPDRLINLTYILIECAERAAIAADEDEIDPLDLLSEAVAASGEGLRLTPSSDRDWWIAGAAHGNALLARYQHTRDAADLSESIDRYERVVAGLPDDHPHRAGQLGNLGSALYLRFEAAGDVTDLARSIDLLRPAIAASEVSHADAAARRLSLGRALLDLSRQGTADNFVEATRNFRAAVGTETALPELRVNAAIAWGRAAVQARQWDVAIAGFSAAVELLPLAAWHGLSRHDREHQLAFWPGLPRDAAACALNAGLPELAVELLEQGRSVIWGQTLRARTDAAELAVSHPELSSRCAQVRDILDQTEAAAIVDAAARSAAGAIGDLRRSSERRLRVAREWDALVETVRTLPGFEDFCRPVPFSRLIKAAADGPVVMVNVSRIRCDALILTAKGLRVLPLENLTWEGAMTHGDAYLRAIQRLTGYGPDFLSRAETRSHLDAIDSTLAWLWRAVAEPVLSQLGLTCVPAESCWPRIWWSPTGPLSLLPIHAAGCYGTGSAATPTSVMDLAVSSYTPTLSALIRARRAGQVITGRRLLIVAVPTPSADSDLPALPGASHEADWLVARFPGCHSRRDGADAVVADVVRLMPLHSIAHFAAHGSQDLAHPSQAGIVLDDGMLTTRQIAALDLSQAELAFLSACQTAIGGVRLLDESINLAAAFQLAGYRHVIGTLWAVSDRRATEVVAEVYAGLGHGDGLGLDDLDVGRTAFALHQAILGLRDRHHVPALLWSPYVHIGP